MNIFIIGVFFVLIYLVSYFNAQLRTTKHKATKRGAILAIQKHRSWKDVNRSILELDDVELSWNFYFKKSPRYELEEFKVVLEIFEKNYFKKIEEYAWSFPHGLVDLDMLEEKIEFIG